MPDSPPPVEPSNVPPSDGCGLNVTGLETGAEELPTMPSVEELANRMSGGMLGAPSAGSVVYALPPIENAAVCLSRDIILPPQVIAGMLHQGDKMVLGGGSKSFKTFMLADLAISVVTGLPWLGLATFQGRVLYLNLELQSAQFTKRLRFICRAKEINVSHLENLSLWNLRGYMTDFAVLIAKIIEIVKDENYSLIIVDPIYKALGGRDENKAGDMTSLLNELEKLAVQSGAAIVFGAHFSKGNQSGKESIDRIGGSGVFARDPDAICVVTPHEEEYAYTFDAILRNHPPVTPFAIRWEYPLMRRDEQLNPGRLRKPANSQKKFFAEDILSLLGDQGLTNGEWMARAKQALGMSNSTFDRLRRELTSAGTIVLSPLEKKWQKTATCTPPATTQDQGVSQPSDL